MLGFTNEVLGTQQKFICNSRPRRFGKSMAANMLAAYYSKGCDSKELFAGLEIAKHADYEKHLNKYDVIHFDVQWCQMMVASAEETVSFISKECFKGAARNIWRRHLRRYKHGCGCAGRY